MAVDLPLISLLAFVPILLVFEQKVAKEAKNFSGVAAISKNQPYQRKAIEFFRLICVPAEGIRNFQFYPVKSYFL
ncbi:MAG: hypothetical protein LAT83_23250 [Kiritimatiellae bacterium]|nr:hypothetical protein [Kiritimatiellia bacterium]